MESAFTPFARPAFGADIEAPLTQASNVGHERHTMFQPIQPTNTAPTIRNAAHAGFENHAFTTEDMEVGELTRGGQITAPHQFEPHEAHRPVAPMPWAQRLPHDDVNAGMQTPRAVAGIHPSSIARSTATRPLPSRRP